MTETTLRAFQTEENEDTPLVRPATADDAFSIYELVSSNVVSGHLLERSLEEVQQHATRFFAAVDSEELGALIEAGQSSLGAETAISMGVQCILPATGPRGLGQTTLTPFPEFPTLHQKAF